VLEPAELVLATTEDEAEGEEEEEEEQIGQLSSKQKHSMEEGL